MRFGRPLFRAVSLAVFIAGLTLAPHTAGAQNTPAAAAASSTTPGTPFTADQLQQLLPPSVYFQGRTATLQLRNAGGTTFPGKAIVWAALVDTSGYATDVRDKYQFYLVTEGPLRIGSQQLRPGAYGAGFLGDTFVVLDLGGHTVATGATHDDAALRRPRPLQVLPGSGTAVKLYLNRHWVELAPGNAH